MFATPASIPELTPEDVTVATDGVPLLHVPPVVEELSVVVEAGQTVEVPVIEEGLGLTVIGYTVKQPPLTV